MVGMSDESSADAAPHIVSVKMKAIDNSNSRFFVFSPPLCLFQIFSYGIFYLTKYPHIKLSKHNHRINLKKNNK